MLRGYRQFHSLHQTEYINIDIPMLKQDFVPEIMNQIIT